ncbi:hypothetical protein VTK56DRAFT_2660 [Thermocarpiscus australiensis]
MLQLCFLGHTLRRERMPQRSNHRIGRGPVQDNVRLRKGKTGKRHLSASQVPPREALDQGVVRKGRLGTCNATRNVRYTCCEWPLFAFSFWSHFRLTHLHAFNPTPPCLFTFLGYCACWWSKYCHFLTWAAASCRTFAAGMLGPESRCLPCVPRFSPMHLPPDDHPTSTVENRQGYVAGPQSFAFRPLPCFAFVPGHPSDPAFL